MMDPVIIDLKRHEAERALSQAEFERIGHLTNQYLPGEMKDLIREKGGGLLREAVEEMPSEGQPFDSWAVMAYERRDTYALANVIMAMLDAYVEREALHRAKDRAEKQVDDEREREALGIDGGAA